MSFEKENTIHSGYKMIFDDIEEKYLYLVLKAGDFTEIPKNELIEMIKSGEPMPIIEIKEKLYSAQTANG